MGSPTTPLDAPAPRPWRLQVCVIVLVVLTLVVYGRSVFFEFVDWDDLNLVIENPILNPVTPAHIADAWKGPIVNLYTPLAYTAWALVTIAARVPTPDPYGIDLNPGLFHALNVALHAGCVVMALLVLRQLFGKGPAPLIGAMVFAFHPIQVEPVGWISGMNNLLAGFFSLGAIAAYIAFARSGSRKAYVFALTCATSGIALQADGDRRAGDDAADRPLHRRPAIRPRNEIGAGDDGAGRAVPDRRPGRETADYIISPTLKQRVPIVADAVGFYFQKVVWPHPLIFDYGRQPQVVIAQGVSTGSWIGLAALGAAVAASLIARKSRYIAAIALLVVGILPVSGIIPFAFQWYSTVADRYAYLGMIGIAIVVTMLLTDLPGKAPIAIGTVLVMIWTVTSFFQLGHWADSYALAKHALRYNPQSFAANDTLGYAYRMDRNLPEAEKYYRQALVLKPSDPTSNMNLGGLLIRTQHPAEAIPYLQRAIDGGLEVPKLRFLLGSAYLQLGHVDEAEHIFQTILKEDPENPSALSGLGYTSASRGQLDQAERYLRRSLEIDPDFVLAKLGLKKVLDAKGTPQSPTQ